MKKRTFDVSFKKEVLEHIENNNTTAYKAARYFYHNEVLDTVSLIALEAYDYICHSRA
jgi:hypothetical protein